MISEEMYDLGSRKSTIRIIFEYGRERAKVVGDDNVFDFSIGNPNIPAPGFIQEGIINLVRKFNPAKLHGYTVAPGVPEVRSILAEDLNRRFGMQLTGENLFMTSGAAGALSITFKALANPGDEFIAIAPYFPEYKVFVEAVGAKLIVVPAKTDDFQIDIEALKAAITPNTKAIIINSPNNPSGAIYSEETIAELTYWADFKSKEYLHPIYIIADEPYRELVYNGMDVPYVPNYYDNTLVCYSYSKTYSLAGERLGYIVVPDTVEEWSKVYAAVAGAARSLGHVNAPALFQYLVAECVGLPAEISTYETNSKLLYNGLIEAGFECYQPEGAFYLFPKALEADDYKFCERARKYDLLLVPGSDFGCPGYFRCSYCVDTDKITRALPLFQQLAAEYKG